MIHKPTVLVLGAGASAPYGYELGKGLVGRILELTAPNLGALWSVLTHGYQGEHLYEFCKSLAKSKPASIDDFLEANEEFRELGRVCTSFERYFANVLSGFYPDVRKGSLSADAFRDSVLPTVHIHGSLGPFLDEVRSLANPLDRNQITWYQRAARTIRILSEGEHAVEYNLARAWIREADVIYFLGFGYHQTNTQRLGLRAQITATAPEHPDRIVKGTALGLGEADRVEVVGRLNVGADIIRGQGLLFQQDARTFLETQGLA